MELKSLHRIAVPPMLNDPPHAADCGTDAASNGGGRIAEFAQAHRWPAVNFSNVASERDSWRREKMFLYSVYGILDRDLEEQHCLVVHLRATRGLVTRLLAVNLWNSINVAVGHWCDLARTEYPRGWRKQPPRVANLFFRDCARFRDRIVPLRMSPPQAFDELARFDLAPNLVFTSAQTGSEVRNDLRLSLRRFPHVPVLGGGWRDPGVRAAVIDFVRRHAVEIDVDDDGWHVWRECDQWLDL